MNNNAFIGSILGDLILYLLCGLGSAVAYQVSISDRLNIRWRGLVFLAGSLAITLVTAAIAVLISHNLMYTSEMIHAVIIQILGLMAQAIGNRVGFSSRLPNHEVAHE